MQGFNSSTVLWIPEVFQTDIIQIGLKSWTIYQIKSMPQKRNHDCTENSPNIKAGSYEPMRNKDILKQEFQEWN